MKKIARAAVIVIATFSYQSLSYAHIVLPKILGDSMACSSRSRQKVLLASASVEKDMIIVYSHKVPNQSCKTGYVLCQCMP